MKELVERARKRAEELRQGMNSSQAAMFLSVDQRQKMGDTAQLLHSMADVLEAKP